MRRAVAYLHRQEPKRQFRAAAEVIAVNVFVVEDDADLREFVESLLGRQHRVRAFPSGKSAIEALRAALPDVLLCDLSLPDMSGEDVADAVAHMKHRPHVVLMSGEHNRLDRARSLAQQVIQKPFSIEELTSVLEASMRDIG
jgi:DNA-binding response OmpR family regulator